MLIRSFISLVLIFSLGSCAKNDHVSMKGCPIEQYDNSKLKSGQLSYRAPGSWQRSEPSNPMRVDEFIIDPTTQSSLAVYFFPGMKDAVEPNLKRWKGQFSEESRKLLEKKQFNRKELPITVYHMTGDYMKTLVPSDPKSKKQKLGNHSLLAAIVETKEGTWFFKTYGPKNLIDTQRANFDKLVNTFDISKS